MPSSIQHRFTSLLLLPPLSLNILIIYDPLPTNLAIRVLGYDMRLGPTHQCGYRIYLVLVLLNFLKVQDLSIDGIYDLVTGKLREIYPTGKEQQGRNFNAITGAEARVDLGITQYPGGDPELVPALSLIAQYLGDIASGERLVSHNGHAVSGITIFVDVNPFLDLLAGIDEEAIHA